MGTIESLLFVIFLANILSAFSYFVLTYILLILYWKLKSAHYLYESDDKVTRKVVIIASIFMISLALFISFCGITHVISAVEYLIINHSAADNNASFIKLKCSFLVVCSLVSCLPAILFLINFSVICSWLNQYKSTSIDSDRLVSVFERMHKSIIILSADLRIIKGNSMTALFFGQDYLGYSIFDIITEDENKSKFQDAFHKLDTDSHSEEVISLEFKSQGNAVKARWLETQITRDEIVTSDGRTDIEYTIITRSIDTRKQNEILQKSLEDNRLQEAVNQSKLLYITSVAHDLKAPLQTFCFGLELILQTTLTENQKDILNQLYVASEMMKLSISQSIDIGKSLDDRRITPRKSTVSLSEIIDQVKVIMTGSFSSVPISYSISPCIEDNIITDREWLWQMLLNLLTNACKYTIEGSIAVTVDLLNGNENVFLHFQVADTGIGVSDSKKSTIFDAFNQAQIGQVTGTGLGLYGLRCRVEALGGICGVKDNVASGSGSIFWFQIPYVTSEKVHEENYEDLRATVDVIKHSHDSLDDFIDKDFNTSNNNNSTNIIKSDQLERKSSTQSSVTKEDLEYKSDHLTRHYFPQIGPLFQSSSPSTSSTSTPSQPVGKHLPIDSIPNTNNPLVLATTTTSTTTPAITLPSYNQFYASKIIPSSITSSSSSSNKKKILSSPSTDGASSTVIATTVSLNNSHSLKNKSHQTIDVTRGVNTSDKKLLHSNSLTFIVPLQIFLIDDSLPILKMTSMTLRNLGFTNIECFENGYAGLQAMKKKYVDIVFTDVQMPVLTGPEMAQRFRDFERTERASGVRKHRQVIIALTANTSEELNAMVPDIFDHICTKPISSKDLRDIMKSFCRTNVEEVEEGNGKRDELV